MIAQILAQIVAGEPSAPVEAELGSNIVGDGGEGYANDEDTSKDESGLVEAIALLCCEGRGEFSSRIEEFYL